MTLDVGIADRSKLYDNMNSGGDQSNESGSGDVGQNKFGITVQPLSQAQQGRLHVSGGVAVTGVKPGSFGDTIGLVQGEVIVEINRQPVTDEASYRAAATRLKSGDEVVFVVRNPQNPSGGNTYLGGTLP